MDDVFNSGQIEEEVFPHKIGFNASSSGSSSSRDTNAVPASDLPTFDPSHVNGTEEFPVFNSTPYENDLFITDQSTTTEDQAEFITHTSTTANKNNNTSTRGGTTSSSTGSSNDSTAQKTQSTIPRRQRGNSNDRSRMRAEEICQEDINFVCELTETLDSPLQKKSNKKKQFTNFDFYRHPSSTTSIKRLETTLLKLKNGFYMKIPTC